MMRGLVLACFIAAGSVLGQPAAVFAEKMQSYAIDGPGAMRCADFVKDFDNPKVQRDVAIWTSGYLTAHQRLISQVYDLTPWQTPGVLLGMLKQFCTDRPQARVERGVAELVGYLLPRALKNPEQVVAVGTGSSTVLLYVSVVKQVRERLGQEGFAAGPSLSDLAKSLADWQSAHGLPATGLADQATLVKLLK